MLVTLAVAALSAVVLALAVIYTGVYNVSATVQHTAPVNWALETAMLKAVERHARGIEAPPLDEPALVRRGMQLHHEACVPCHGAPGVAPHAAGQGLLPVPNNLVQTAREWEAAQVYWVTRNGLKMTGMPAWGMRFGDEDLWAIVAFVKMLPRLTAAEYQRLLREGGAAPEARAERDTGRPGDPERGLLALQQYACTTCHVIPGIAGSRIHVGPPLAEVASRGYLAGTLPNSAGNMVRWIRDPGGISPATLMPDLGVSEEHARDMVAYLYSLR